MPDIQAPRPVAERISNLINRISSGDIKIPKFQRGFIWKETQILELLDSIYLGYPIGSLLFWLTQEPMRVERDIGGFELPATPDKYPRNYILDGQQRLTTIYGVLKWNKPTALHKLNVYFDLEQQKFFHYNGAVKDTHVPMSILFETSKFLIFRSKLDQHVNSEELQKQFDVLYEVFREYLIPVVTIAEKTVEEVCPIFERINSTGTQLDVFDLMAAATWKDDFDLNDEINKVKESIKLKNFEHIKNSAYLKMMSAVYNFGVKKSSLFKLRKLDSNELKLLANNVKLAAERAIDFLSTDLSIPSDSFLPYEDQLVILTYFFSKVPNPTHQQLSCLRKWFWQTGFSEHFRGAAEGTVQKHITSIDLLIDGDSSSLNIRVSLVENDLLKRQFIKNSAFCKTYTLMLMQKSPRNITNGEKIDHNVALTHYSKQEFHHIFPQDFLKDKGINADERNNICNICMLSSAQNKIVSNAVPSEYILKCIENLNGYSADVLKSNLIPINDDAGWRENDYKMFLNQRAKLILEEIKILTANETVNVNF